MNNTLIVQQTERSRILKTKDYSLFRCSEKIKINNSYVDNMVVWMTEKNLSKDLPIIVDQNYNILDGRYRFLANERLNAPIYYKVAEVGNIVDFLQTKNTVLKLGAKEWALFYKDNVNYRKLLEKCDTFLPYSFISICSCILGYSQLYRIRFFTSGLFIYTDECENKFRQLNTIISTYNNKFTTNYMIGMDDLHNLIAFLKTMDNVLLFLDDKDGKVKRFLYEYDNDLLGDTTKNLNRLIVDFAKDNGFLGAKIKNDIELFSYYKLPVNA